jgi:hypothetical protein
MEFNIYAGLSGSFGGARYVGTVDCGDVIQAEDIAHEQAIEEYESYAGLHGLLTWNDIKDENPEESDDDIDLMYLEEMENWIESYVILTEEDGEVEEDEIFYLC